MWVINATLKVTLIKINEISQTSNSKTRYIEHSISGNWHTGYRNSDFQVEHPKLEHSEIEIQNMWCRKIRNRSFECWKVGTAHFQQLEIRELRIQTSEIRKLGEAKQHKLEFGNWKLEHPSFGHLGKLGIQQTENPKIKTREMETWVEEFHNIEIRIKRTGNSEPGGTMDNFGIWGNQWDVPGVTNRGGRHSGAFRKLGKKPLKLRLVRE